MTLSFDSLSTPYSSKRSVTYARNGMVATSQPLAAQAGLDILKKGGNAVDAAIATAACLTVVEPTSNGIGGDAFALVWMKDELFGLSANGPAPKGISIEAVKEAGHEKMPKYGWTPVTVPGVPAAWAALSKRFGKLSLSEVLAPAIEYAEKGYPVSPVLGYFWKRGVEVFREHAKGPEFEAWFETFAPNGNAPEIGEMWSSPNHASTLREIGETNAASFYSGSLADRIEAESIQHGGYLRKEDLSNYQVEWVDPIKVNYRGYDVWEIPPSGQGIVALMALNVLKGFDFSSRESTDTLHKQIEAMKMAFSSGKYYVTDPKHMPVTTESLLSEAFAAQRRSEIGNEAHLPEPGTPPKGGTVYLATADGEGNMVSFIQSNYMGFGSGIVIPGTGIGLQNRGYDFKLDAEHPNALLGGKKTYHTIIPGFLTKDGKAVGPFGVMGGYMQPQGHVQVVMNTIDFGLNPQAALDAPRWQCTEGKIVEFEKDFPSHLVEALARKGHDVRVAPNSGSFGRGQIIWRDSETGVLIGGTESRTDGAVASW